jgi:hypothetical protein
MTQTVFEIPDEGQSGKLKVMLHDLTKPEANSTKLVDADSLGAVTTNWAYLDVTPKYFNDPNILDAEIVNNTIVSRKINCKAFNSDVEIVIIPAFNGQLFLFEKVDDTPFKVIISTAAGENGEGQSVLLENKNESVLIEVFSFPALGQGNSFHVIAKNETAGATPTGLPYKSFVAEMFFQSGQPPVVQAVFLDELGYEENNRNTTGDYCLKFTLGSLVIDKTPAINLISNGLGVELGGSYGNPSTFKLASNLNGLAADYAGVITLEIRVYN